jgi:hypothetical protein
LFGIFNDIGDFFQYFKSGLSARTVAENSFLTCLGDSRGTLQPE